VTTAESKIELVYQKISRLHYRIAYAMMTS